MLNKNTEHFDSPEFLRGVFGHNLRKLTSEHKSVAQLTRELGINRTQFNRYLSGEAFPRPDILHKICAYFERDARILLEPIEKLDNAKADNVRENVNIMPMISRMFHFDHTRVPDGVYRWIQPSLMRRGRIVLNLVHFTTLPNAMKQVTVAFPRFMAEASGTSTQWRDRKQIGMAFQHADGFSMLFKYPGLEPFFNSFFSLGFRGISTVKAGFTTATQMSSTAQSQAQPAILQYIQGGCSEVLQARRQCGEIDISSIPEDQQDYLRNWSPFAPGVDT
ncbi:helix-turn-helix domain-containing protein [Actibacterium lipolyticum]|uniref:HTH cro/C1-type domain-containing protein n=1 Tax=Actibacterium lipolyticum TaxID=1524263 RepID=A0A238KHZ1_9RHOB|nr:helix-turn-helix transcriptional regulator [Actibacterium lipolyticum]SMX42360.1 hypothetical protein COL8621_01950 [Actibacterium lipolyticum]